MRASRPTHACVSIPPETGRGAHPRRTLRRCVAQATGKRVVNFLVRRTKLVLTERTARICST